MTLTPRQRAVARLVTMGRTNKEISDELRITVRVVEWHVGNIAQHWGIRRGSFRAQIATRYMHEYGANDLVA